MKIICEQLLTPKDIMTIFSIGKNQAYALMHTAGFPTLKINKRMYVKRSSLDKWLDTYSGREYFV